MKCGILRTGQANSSPYRRCISVHPSQASRSSNTMPSMCQKPQVWGLICGARRLHDLEMFEDRVQTEHVDVGAFEQGISLARLRNGFTDKQARTYRVLTELLHDCLKTSFVGSTTLR